MELVDIFWRSNGYYLAPGITNPFAIELIFWVAILLVAVVFYLRPRYFASVERIVLRISRRPALSVLLVAFAALTLRAALLPLIPIPKPAVEDEFSYLLGADTLASGRLTNPAPPLWIFFETFHVNVQPTYESMYPPAQSAVLALGERFTGRAWVGVWLSVALMCASLCWMLQGWMPPPWPLIGGVFCVLRFSVFSYWMNSYMGGAVAATGGALVLGAAVRLRRKLTPGNSVVLAIGLALLANSRPYEGLVFCIPVLITLAVWLRHRSVKEVWKRAVVPACVILGCAAAFMLYYNWRGTGSPLLMPYKLNQARYHVTNMFLWQDRNPIPQYNNAAMRKLYVYWEMPDFLRLHSPGGVWVISQRKFETYYGFYIFPLCILFLPTCYLLMKSPKRRIFPIVILVELAGSLAILWQAQPHYAAAALCAVLATLLLGLRLLRTWRPRRRPVGLALARAVVFVMTCWLVFLGVHMAYNWPKADNKQPIIPHEFDRARIQAQLQRLPGRQLIFVKTRRDHDPTQDWVYNGADIAAQKVIWARDLGRDMDAKLLRYFPDRHAWIVDQDDGIRRVTDYESRPELATGSQAMKLVLEHGN